MNRKKLIMQLLGLLGLGVGYGYQNSLFLFRENKGQVHDERYNPRPDVLFSGEAQGIVFHLLRSQIYYQIFRSYPVPARTPEELAKLPPDQRAPGGEIFRVVLSFVGADPNPVIEKGTPSPDYENFYNTGREGIPFVRRYDRVRYRSVYSGIDLVFHAGPQGEMEYTWVVAPGADPRAIVVESDWPVRVEGAYLVYETPLGTIREGPLRAWQAGGRSVSVCYQVE
ncbi:MAG: hypothetical protein RMJ57_09085, partial [Bacteroidia bacterium]|nr:hypothetical protein [Bacteroidia bacterium]